MLFMCQGTPRPGLAPEERQKVLQLFASWQPPAALEIKAHFATVTGGDYVIVETGSVEALIEAIAVWAPFVDYTVTPIVDIQAGLGGIARGEDVRRNLI